MTFKKSRMVLRILIFFIQVYVSVTEGETKLNYFTTTSNPNDQYNQYSANNQYSSYYNPYSGSNSYYSPYSGSQYSNYVPTTASPYGYYMPPTISYNNLQTQSPYLSNYNMTGFPYMNLMTTPYPYNLPPTPVNYYVNPIYGKLFYLLF